MYFNHKNERLHQVKASGTLATYKISCFKFKMFNALSSVADVTEPDPNLNIISIYLGSGRVSILAQLHARTIPVLNGILVPVISPYM